MRIRLDEGAKEPTRGTPWAAGYDVYACEDKVVYPGDSEKIRTGLHLEMDRDLVGILSHRSGMHTKQGADVYGTIDPDYRGEIQVTMYNRSIENPIYIKAGDRIAQLVFHKIHRPIFKVVDELKGTKRGEGGHGSTGR